MHIIKPADSLFTDLEDRLTIALCQMAPIWLNRNATLEKVCENIVRAADNGAQLVCFGEALVPGYPFWVERTNGAAFNDHTQKEIYALYLDQGVRIEAGDLQSVQDIAKARNIAVYLGCMERAPERGGHTLYCSLIYIDATGTIASVHRKLQPTYEERLVWGQGDGHGLQVHDLGPFRVGGLNCFENWMPLPRAALYAQGESLHVSVWPGGLHNTEDLPLVLAKEGRSYVAAVSGVMRPQDVPADMPAAAEILKDTNPFFANGGTGLAGPDGRWLVAPVIEEEVLIVADISHKEVRRERQNFDVSGHYSRPDVTKLTVNRKRQQIVDFED